MVQKANPLSRIDDVFNGILINANMVGEVMFYGPGAGKLPTASAVCADIVDAIAHADGIKLPEFKVATEDDVADFENYSCRRMFIFDKCGECKLDSKVAEKCFGCTIGQFVVNGNRVALITEAMTEAKAREFVEKLSNCKSYRLL
jgi:homoserine dehydrogenase